MDLKSMDLSAILGRLAKWRIVFAGWQLGTRDKNDPECQAVKDQRELLLFLRVEVTALTGLLLKKGVFTQEEFSDAVAEEAERYDRQLELRFPGFKATDTGMTMQFPEVTQTMKGWPP